MNDIPHSIETDRSRVRANGYGQRMRRYLTSLDHWLRCMDFAYVRAEYVGGEGRGMFFALHCYQANESECWIANGVRTARVAAVFAALLEFRHPTWREGEGSCGDFRWDIASDRVTHTHVVRGIRRERMIHVGPDALRHHISCGLPRPILTPSR